LYFSNFADWEGQIKVEEWVKLAHESQIPAFIDAAADTPPVSLVAYAFSIRGSSYLHHPPVLCLNAIAQTHLRPMKSII